MRGCILDIHHAPHKNKMVGENHIFVLTQKIEKLKKENEENNKKITKFWNAIIDLENILDE